MKPVPLHTRQTGFGLTELLIFAALSSLMAAALYTGALALQRSFFAGQHFVRTQSEQMRVLDYIARDARCATAVSWSTDRKTLSLMLPDFYDTTDPNNPVPRTPQYSARGQVIYGNGSLVPVSYFKKGNTIVRSTNGTETVLVSDVQSFELTFPEAINPKSIQATVSFIPKFGRKASESLREHNTGSVTILLRNKLG